MRSTSSGGPLSPQAVDALLHLEEVADLAAQGLVHVRDDRRHPPAQARARGHEGPRERRAPARGSS